MTGRDTTGREMSVGALWRDTVERVGGRSEARWLCEVATGLDGDELTAALDEPVTERMVAHLDAMLARRDAGEPLQYVLGRWGFRHLDLAVDPRVLIPRPETELVAGTALGLAGEVRRRVGQVTVADLGTGSGAIGLALVDELPLDGVEVWITDVDEDALDVARANLAGIGRRASNVRVAAGSWFDALPADAVFDVLVSNPPYVAVGSADLDPAVHGWEPSVALDAGADGLDHVRVLVAGAQTRLPPGGWLVLEIGADQGDAVATLLRGHGYVDVDVRPDDAGRDRVALGRRPDRRSR